MEFAPENFWYFVIGFFISSVIGTVYLLNYKRTWLNYINAFLFFLSASRFLTEYALQHATTYESALILQRFNGGLGNLFFLLTWTMLYYYVSPFPRRKYKKQLDLFVGIFILLIPGILTTYFIVSSQVFILNTQQLEGYWTFRVADTLAFQIHFIYSFVFMAIIFNLFLYSYSITMHKGDRIKKIFLAIVSFCIIFLVSVSYENFYSPDWKIPSFAINVLLNAIVISWFVSGYKGLRDGYKSASEDVLNSISDLSIGTDQEFIINSSNNATLASFDQPNGSIVQFLSGQSHLNKGEMEKIIQPLIDKTISAQELELVTKTNEVRAYQIKASESSWRGKNSGFQFLLTDMTELKEKEIELAQLNESKDQLFSIIAHDLKRPALAFRGITSKINYLIEKKDYQLLDTLGASVEKSATQLNALLDNLLTWALSQKNLLKVEKTPVNIKQIADQVVQSFENLAAEKGIELNTANIQSEHIIHTDPKIFSTILRNLIDNAIKFSTAESMVILESQQLTNHIRVTIKDFGLGMSEEQLSKLFESYRGKSNTGTHGEQGSGLGLNLVHDLVQKSNAQIDYQSAIGNGTEVKLTYASLRNHKISP